MNLSSTVKLSKLFQCLKEHIFPTTDFVTPILDGQRHRFVFLLPSVLLMKAMKLSFTMSLILMIFRHSKEEGIKNRWRSFKQCHAMFTVCALISREHCCAFQLVFQMMKCSLIDCVSLIPKRLEESGTELCSAFMILVVSTPSISIQNAPFPVNKHLKHCSPMPLTNNQQYG